MSELVKRLREDVKGCPFPRVYSNCMDAAKRIEELEGALRDMKDLAEFWINREDTGRKSKSDYDLWLVLGHRSLAMKRAREALK